MIFEGQYVNGIKCGKAIEYYKNSKIKFEGIYFNNKRYRIGKEYNFEGILIYEGKYLNGKKMDDIENKINFNSNKVLKDKEVYDNRNIIVFYLFWILFLIFLLQKYII